MGPLKEGRMNQAVHRRGFLGRILGASAAATLGVFNTSPADAQTSDPDAWIGGVKGRHRALFDFPQHKNGVPLLHILNYLNTYSAAYQTGAGEVGAVGTFYGIGPQSSIPLAFNDAIWSKYAIGEYLSLKDASGRAYTRNVFHRPTPNDLHLLMQAMQTPTLPGFAAAIPALGIESLQKMGTTFLICANALGAWCQELEARGKGKAPELEKELRANLLPGVIAVPAMVIAIEKAQGAGMAYNRQ
jgi:intracellular sulfur oxidation DsrE/DsrF family protein